MSSNSCFTEEMSAFSRIAIEKIYFANSSRTVNGSHFSRSRVYHYPLKSTVHRSFGFSGTILFWMLSDNAFRLRLRDSTKPAFFSILSTVLHAGILSCEWLLAYTSRIFFGPQLSFVFLILISSQIISSERCVGHR